MEGVDLAVVDVDHFWRRLTTRPHDGDHGGRAREHVLERARERELVCPGNMLGAV